MKSEPESRKIRWGVLGCARVAEAVAIPGIQRSGNGTVLAVASRDLAKAEDWARQFAIERSYANYEALIADPDVEAVYIPLINSLHREWTIRAAERGKHVLCEKPLACSVREAQEMVEACSRYGVILMETFAHRFQPQNLQVKKLINDGKIGKVVGMTAVHSSGRPPSGDIRLDKDLGGGVLGDKGCYCVNTARFIMESEPDSVYASIVFGDQSGVDERVRAVIHFPGNATVFFDSGFCLALGNYYQGYELFGEGGRIAVPTGFTQLDTYRRNEVVDTSIFITDTANHQEKIDVKGKHQWQLEVEYFADRILNNEELHFPAEDGLANMRVLDAIYESARQGRPVDL